MVLHTFETSDGTKYDIIKREVFRQDLMETDWVVYVVPQGTETLLGMRLRYSLAFQPQARDNMARDFAVAQYALENDRDKVFADSRKPSGYDVECGQEPYLSLCKSF